MSQQYSNFLKTETVNKLTGEVSEVLAPEPSVLSIEQLNLQLKQLIEGHLPVVWVQGEISNFKPHSSGHFYFSLKDSKAQISALMFRGFNSKLKFKPHDGMQVIVRGRVTVYEPRGTYQIACETMEPVGAGALQKAFEQLKLKLRAEGLFEPARKRAIPAFPMRIAVITSPTGAAIRDMINVLSRRAKNLEVILVPTVVQGESAAPQIIEAFKKTWKINNVDVIIVGRGGGSIEDMWCFNDEALARTIAASPIPVISAIGHEIDFTIADFVADLRAPTPSAAAELVTKNFVEIQNRLVQQERMLKLGMSKVLKHFQQKVEMFSKRLVDPQRKLQDLQQRNDDLLNRLEFALQRGIERKRHRVQLLTQKMGSPEKIILDRRNRLEKQLVQLKRSISLSLERRTNRLNQKMILLDSFSPLKVVDRGYAILTNHKNKVIKSNQDVVVGEELSARLAEGELTVKVLKN